MVRMIPPPFEIYKPPLWLRLPVDADAPVHLGEVQLSSTALKTHFRSECYFYTHMEGQLLCHVCILSLSLLDTPSAGIIPCMASGSTRVRERDCFLHDGLFSQHLNPLRLGTFAPKLHLQPGDESTTVQLCNRLNPAASASCHHKY